MRRGLLRGLLHIELTPAIPAVNGTGNLARILRTIRENNQNWFRQILNQFNAQAADATAVPTGWLRAVAGENEVPVHMAEVADAIRQSYSMRPIGVQSRDRSAFDDNVGYRPPFPKLYEFALSVQAQRIGSTSSGQMWKRFRFIHKDLRFPSWYEHPTTDPDMKIGATSAQQTKDNRSRNNERPDPSRWISLRNELAKSLTTFKELALSAVLLQEEQIDFTADLGKAQRLAADLKAHPSVLSGHFGTDWLQSLDSVLDLWKSQGKIRTMSIRCYLGVFGCGKTTAMIAYLDFLAFEDRRNIRVVSHTESLRAQAKAKLDYPEFRG